MNKTTKGYIVYKAALCFVVGLIVIIFDLKITSSMLIEEIHQVQDNVLVEAVVTHSVKTYEGKDSDGFIEREYDLTVEYKYNQTVYESIIHTSSEYDVGDEFEIHINPNNPQENRGINGGVGDFAGMLILFIPLLFFGIYMIHKGNSYRTSITKNAKVTVRVSRIGTENREDTDGRSWLEHCVYVDYEYNGKKYKNIYWYGAETKNKFRSTLEKELKQFPKKGETFQIYINPNKPNEILSKAPFRIVN